MIKNNQMDEFGSLQGRTYELGGLAGAMGALRAFKASKECQQQMARIISQLGKFNLSKIISQFGKEFDTERLDLKSVKSAPSILSARLFQGYVQGFCETQQFIKSLPATTPPQLVWVYANPTLGQESNDAFALAQQELALIADDFNIPNETGKCPYADFLLIVRTYYNKAYQFHLICYELSTHNAPTIDTEINLSNPDDIFESLKRGKNALINLTKTRDFRIASETLGLEISPELKNYFTGLLTHDKIAKKLFQGGGYVYSLYETIKDRIQWKKAKIEFHVVAFTERNRHFLHVKEEESELLQNMGDIYQQGIKNGRYDSPEQQSKLREAQIVNTEKAILRQIGANVLSVLREPLRDLYKRAQKTFECQQPLSGNIDYSFSEKIEGYCPTATPPSFEQLQSWLPIELAKQLQAAESMQDAHAELVKSVWKDNDILVLSGTPGIGKTTALRSILADYPSGYLLIYLSPRIQVNMDLMAKFDPTHEGNNLKGKEELICINTNSTLIKVAKSHHGKVALSCCSHNIPYDPNFWFLSQKDAESLEIKEPKNQSNYRRTEISATTEVSRDTHHGVFKTITQAIHRLNDRYGYKRIIACVATQSNRQLNRETTTVGAHLSKMFSDSHKKLDIASIEQFANNIKEIVFFIDEVTGDGAGRQTVQEMIQFRKDVINKFDDVGKSCPLKIRVLIADASLVNASSVESYLNEKQSQPEQILFTGDADCKGLSIEDTKILGQPAKIINANVYPAATLTLKWRPILDFYAIKNQNDEKKGVAKAYRELENALRPKLAQELVERWQQKPQEQTIVIIQNKESIEQLRNSIIEYDSHPDIICLHAHSKPQLKRDIVSPATAEEKSQKRRQVPISQKGDLADIILMTSSGTRGISFPNASKIICLIPTFSIESNFMEFLQGMYRGRGSGKGNQLDREIELIIPQVLVAPTGGSTKAIQASQISNLFATLMLMRMSILTRLFGASELFGQSVSCIPISGSLVEGAAQSTMDDISSAIDALERAHKQNPSDTKLRYIKEHIRDVFKNENVVLHHNAQYATTLASTECRNRLLKQFIQDANRGLNVIATENYIPEGCYTMGELILQKLDSLEGDIREKNRHLVETHIEEQLKAIKEICVKLRSFTKDKNTIRAVRDPANILYPILNVIAGGEPDSDTESELGGTVLNRWLAFPALHIDNFWKNQVEPLRFKEDIKEMMKEYFHAYLCQPNYTLPIHSHYDDNALPWLLLRGPEIEQRLNAQYQTRYFVSSKSLSLLNIMLLAHAAKEDKNNG
jgi:hypothetical protein